jgi:hypothetical protein
MGTEDRAGQPRGTSRDVVPRRFVTLRECKPKQPIPNDKNDDSGETRIALSVKRATWVIAVATAVNVVVVGLQWREMKSTGKQTDDLIEATKKLAEAAVKQAEAANSNAETAIGQLKIVAADQRPWMKVTEVKASIHPLMPPEFSGLRWEANDPNFPAFLPLHFMLKNVGKAPAFNVRVGIGAVYGYADKIDDLAKQQREQCTALDTAYPQGPQLVDNNDISSIVFPGDEVPNDSIAIVVLREKVEQFGDGEPGKKTFQLWFYGCVRYTFANSNDAHQTSFAYRLGHIVEAPIPGGKALVPGFKFMENIPGDKLWFESRPRTAGITD